MACIWNRLGDTRLDIFSFRLVKLRKNRKITHARATKVTANALIVMQYSIGSQQQETEPSIYVRLPYYQYICFQ